MSKELCLVIDINGEVLSPTSYNKGWILLRRKKAKLISRLPFTIQLLREQKNTDNSRNILGIDTGSKHTGIAIVQECETKNKPIFKGTIEHKDDVKKKMELRKGYRNYRRSHKRYRKSRFDNRASSKRTNRLAPSIKTKKDEIIRTVLKLSKYIKIDKIIIEDVQIDIRALTEGKNLYKWEYQKSNRLDENLRKASLMRDNYTCVECGKINTMLEVHHIVPKRLKGADTINNLITLCTNCHDKTEGKEEIFIEKYQKMINGKSIRFDYAQHVMQGKYYLRKELNQICDIELTNGGDTANKRIDWGIEKTHSNDAIVITGLKTKDCNIREYIIKPLRSKKKNKVENVLGFEHRDIIRYTKRNGETYFGYITSLDDNKKTCNFTDFKGKIFKRYGLKNCKLIQRPKGLIFA